MSTVIRDAIGYEYGDHPRKNFTLGRDEFVAVNGRTATVPLGLHPTKLDHYEGEANALDGETGTATFAVDDGSDVLPLKLELPEWLDRVVTKHGLALSAVFNNRREKKLVKFDFVKNPFCKRAVLLSEPTVSFSDEADAADADEEDDADDAYQRHHELIAAHHPELCDPGHKPGGGKGDAMLALHDDCVANGAYCPGRRETTDDPEPGATTMSDERENEIEDTTAADAVAFSEGRLDDIKNPTIKALAKQAKDATDRAARLQADMLEKDAVAFSESMIAGKDARATPAERGEIIRQYKLNARLDEIDGGKATVSFSDGGKPATGTNLDAFKAGFRSRPSLGDLKAEKVVGSVELSAEPTGDDKAEDAAREERRKQNHAHFGGKK